MPCKVSASFCYVQNTGGLMSSVTNKMRRQPSGKENGSKVPIAVTGIKEYSDLPTVPATRTGYDRYGAQPQYAPQQVWAN